MPSQAKITRKTRENDVAILMPPDGGKKPKMWDDVEEDDPLPDEIAAFEEYRASKASSA